MHDDIQASRRRRSVVARQFAVFSVIGVLAAVTQYAVLILLVEPGLTDPISANLAAYFCGGVVSYCLNRRHTFESNRPHSQAVWRFAAVATVGFFLTGIFTYAFYEGLALPYLMAAVMTSGVVLFWNFAANRLWTFANNRRPASL